MNKAFVVLGSWDHVQNKNNSNKIYISAITDPISTKLEIITITTETTTITTKTKTFRINCITFP